MHDVLSVAITIATILIATAFNNSAINGLRGEMNGLRGEMNGLRSEMNSIRSELLAKLDSIQRDMRELYAEQARHDTRITALERASERQ